MIQLKGDLVPVRVRVKVPVRTVASAQPCLLALAFCGSRSAIPGFHHILPSFISCSASLSASIASAPELASSVHLGDLIFPGPLQALLDAFRLRKAAAMAIREEIVASAVSHPLHVFATDGSRIHSSLC